MRSDASKVSTFSSFLSLQLVVERAKACERLGAKRVSSMTLSTNKNQIDMHNSQTHEIILANVFESALNLSLR